MRICKEEKKMYNHEAPAHRKLILRSLLICWGIIRYAVNLLFFNWAYILCGIAFSALCFLGLSLLQKRTEDEL